MAPTKPKPWEMYVLYCFEGKEIGLRRGKERRPLLFLQGASGVSPCAGAPTEFSIKVNKDGRPKFRTEKSSF